MNDALMIDILLFFVTYLFIHLTIVSGQYRRVKHQVELLDLEVNSYRLFMSKTMDFQEKLYLSMQEAAKELTEKGVENGKEN